MVVATAATGTATAFGYDAGGFNAAEVATGTAKAVGYAAMGIPATPAAGAAPDALRLEILTEAGTQLVNDLVARRNLTFTVEHNGSGVISFETDLDALTDGIDSALLDPSNLVRVHFGDLPGWPFGVAEGTITSAPPSKDDTGRWTLPVTCPGSWDVLDLGLLWPPSGATGETREFSYTAGQTGPAYVPEEWGTPHGYLVKNSFRWKHRWPRGWPDARARWLWSSSPEKNSGEGTRKFISDPFTLTSTRNVRFNAAGDDNLKLYLNGARIKTKGRGAWKRNSRFIRRLKAGTYVVAAEVANMSGGDNKSGFIFSAELLKANGDREKWLLRSTTSSFKVRTGGGTFAQVPLPPDGWYPAAVLYTHVAEAAARGVDFHPSIVPTFTTKLDSNGTAWTVKGPVEYDISTTGAELGEKIRGLGIDVAMLPGLRLSSWAHRGFDLRDHVVISAPLGAAWSSRAWPRVRTVGLTHHESGWTETAGDAAVSAEFGRRELAISGGGVDGDQQADVFAAAALAAAASPEETIEVQVTAADLRAGVPQPFRDYGPADIITVETVGGFQAMKVMTITGTEQDTKEARWTIAGYPV